MPWCSLDSVPRRWISQNKRRLRTGRLWMLILLNFLLGRLAFITYTGGIQCYWWIIFISLQIPLLNLKCCGDKKIMCLFMLIWWSSSLGWWIRIRNEALNQQANVVGRFSSREETPLRFFLPNIFFFSMGVPSTLPHQLHVDNRELIKLIEHRRFWFTDVDQKLPFWYCNQCTCIDTEVTHMRNCVLFVFPWDNIISEIVTSGWHPWIKTSYLQYRMRVRVHDPRESHETLAGSCSCGMLMTCIIGIMQIKSCTETRRKATWLFLKRFQPTAICFLYQSMK